MREDVIGDTLATRREEVAAKLEAVRQIMALEDLDALHLTTVANTAWLTAGAATYVNESIEEAALSALVTPSEALILTDPIEAPRLLDEERLDQLGFTLAVEPWYTHGVSLDRLTRGKRVASDRPGDGPNTSISHALTTLRATLAAGERARLRAGSRLAAEAMKEAALALRPGMTEWQVAGLLAGACKDRGGTATVALVGSDERVSSYRHPLPTNKVIQRYVMLVLCFRYRGLVSALTRSVHFGDVPSALLETARSVAQVDARLIMGTRSGLTLGDMFALASDAYANLGQPEAIGHHHQGGPIAYLAREALATPEGDWTIAVHQAFAWNPSLRGAKSEDTILLTDTGPEVLTAVEGWPLWRVESSRGAIERPAILAVSPGETTAWP